MCVFVLSCFCTGESPRVACPGACVLSQDPASLGESSGGPSPLSGAGFWTAGEMWQLYTAKLCGFLLPVSRQQALEPNQLSLPVFTEGGRGAPQGTYHCKHLSAGVTVAVWSSPAPGQPRCIMLFVKFFLGTEFTQGLGNFVSFPLEAKAKWFLFLIQHLLTFLVSATPAVPSPLPRGACAVEEEASGSSAQIPCR